LYWLLISVPAARRSFLNLPASEGRELLQQLLHLPRRSFHGRNAMPQTLRSIFEHHADLKNPLRVADLRNLLVRFLLDVISSGREVQPVVFSPHVRAALEHIKAGVEEPLPLAELATRVKLSLPRLKSKFKEEVGVSPGDYIIRCRIERAAQLLYETRATVTDIAMRLGFSSSQYFATVFKRYTRSTPREARTVRVVLS
jgi:AraC-like DNA-binding protein